MRGDGRGFVIDQPLRGRRAGPGVGLRTGSSNSLDQQLQCFGGEVSPVGIGRVGIVRSPVFLFRECSSYVVNRAALVVGETGEVVRPFRSE